MNESFNEELEILNEEVKSNQKSYRLDLTIEELSDLYSNLDQCESEGYIHYGSPSYFLMRKLEKIIE